MAPNKKKKKPAANPARGFATTSIASKPKAETVNNSTDISGTAAPNTAPTSIASEDTVDLSAKARSSETKELQELTPEELEEQLERNDLQIAVEKYAAKARKDATRHISKLQTERRLLRGQAYTLRINDWLPNNLVLTILDLAQGYIADMSSIPTPISQAKRIPEDDLVSRLWTLDIILAELRFSEDRRRSVLEYILANQPPESSAQPWGLQESLEWLALHGEPEEIRPYDALINRSAETSQPNSRPESPTKEAPKLLQAQLEENETQSPLPSYHKGSFPLSATEDIEVSDLDSDLEPDELLSTYLKIKSRLFDINPEFGEDQASKVTKSKRKSQGTSVSSVPSSPGISKLLRQLQQIETDILFDKDEAQALWIPKRNLLAQEKTARMKLNLDIRKKSSQQNTPQNCVANNVPQDPPSVDELPVHSGTLTDEEDLVGMSDMFGAGMEITETSHEDTNPGNSKSKGVTIRDFGKSTGGLSPRRVLEEACRSRESTSKIILKLISPTTYASRHSVTIIWSKDNDGVSIPSFPGISTETFSRSVAFSMVDIATPDIQQSESFICTVALFYLFSNSPKEEKVYLRLPPNWRDFWSELVEFRKDRTDSLDRETIKNFRKLIQAHTSTEDDEDVVLTSALRARNKLANAQTPGPTQDVPNGGILNDPEAYREIWAKKSSTPSYQKMLSVRSSLPIFQFRDTILSTISRHQVAILCGETGCGKSTQLPAYVLEHELSNSRSCKIYCTEPRRISAISLAQRVSEELGEHRNDVGTSRSLVGYAIRLESHIAAQTRLIYATVGIVLRMLEGAKGLSDITHLIIDEVHERSIDTDFLLIVLRSLMIRRPELKVILMSATVDAERFSSYLDGAPIVTVPGRTFPVEARFLEDAIELTGHSVDSQTQEVDLSDDDDDLAQDSKSTNSIQLQGYSSNTRKTLAIYEEYRIDYNLIIKLIDRIASDPTYIQYSQAILIFLPGIAEIRKLNDMLLAHKSFSEQWFIYPLHSTVSSEDQQQAFVVPPPGFRKIVLATNIAETGITIPDITCVIDTGKHKEMRFDERRQLSRLIQSFISRANAKQRRGRAGRVQEGLCFHLFTKYRHDTLMAEQQTPEMLRLSLQDLVMRVKICKLGDIAQTLSEALDPPSAKNIQRAIDALIEVDALTPSEELTPLGRQLAKLPLDAILGKLVLLGSLFGTLDVALTIAAILSSKSPFITPLGARQRADTIRLGFKKGDSDLLTAYNAYSAWRRVCTTPGHSEHQFCKKNFLSPQNLSNIEDLKAQLLSSLLDANLLTLSPSDRTSLSRVRPGAHPRAFVPVPAPYNTHTANDVLINALVAYAFHPKLLARDGKGWRNIANNQSVSLHPTSVNKATQNNLKFVSYYSIMQSSKFYNAHHTSAVQDFALLLGAGEVEFKMHAGVVVLDGNRVRFALPDLRVMVAVKMLRGRVREVVERVLRKPEVGVGERLGRWMEVFLEVFERVDRKGREG
ncbi:ATP-dependent RNA helicase A [Patellaria atrata CBS 101060]|uniref:RNA helicase n=1 Tax=Patellaria atrata CBS 101060 TaxID=1346257 RepID=A0A9P4VQ58_9PEZI|nr:ATP-dependent RNA helicase A [Patellaria atrata CBS 101060]